MSVGGAFYFALGASGCSHVRVSKASYLVSFLGCLRGRARVGACANAVLKLRTVMRRET